LAKSLGKAVGGWSSRFEKANAPLKHRIIARSTGEVGTGKTTFWLGAPAPIVIFSFDKGLEGVIEPYQEKKDIYLAEYDWHPTEDLTQEDAVALRDKFTTDFEVAIQNARTVVIDKETDLWELFRYAEFGGPNDAPRNYPKLNQRYRRYINMPKSLDINFGTIQGMKDEWKTISSVDRNSGAVKEKGASTGHRIPSGFGELDALVHINLHHRREKGEFLIDVGKSRGPGGHDIQDQTFPGLTFVDFAQLVFPSTDETDWL
jgi:hypothetical protein